MTCPKYFYVDPKSKDCEPCHKLCHQAEVTGKEAECRQYCPVVPSTEILPEPHRSLTKGPVLPGLVGEEAITVATVNHAILVVVILFSISIIIVSLTGLYILLRHRNDRRMKSQSKTTGEMVCFSLCVVLVVRSFGKILIQPENHHAYYQKENLNVGQETFVL